MRAKIIIERDVCSATEQELSTWLYKPYQYFENVIDSLSLGPHSRILEIGAGTGFLTNALVNTGSFVTATDISEK